MKKTIPHLSGNTSKGTYLHENNILTLVTTWTYDGRNIGERETVEYYFENGRLFLPNNSSYDRDGKRYDVESFSEYKRK